MCFHSNLFTTFFVLILGLLGILFQFSFISLFKMQNHKTADGCPDLTRKHPLGVVYERVVHKPSSGGGIVPAKLVLGNQCVEAVVEVRGLVQREAAVLD